MASSTKTRTNTPDVKPGANYDEVMRHIADLSERINYVVDTLQGHAAEIKNQKEIVGRIRTRLGL